MKNYRKIKSLMVLHGVSSKDIAIAAGVKQTTVSIVLTGRRRSKNIETAIANSLGMPREKLWPPKTARRAAA